MVEDLDMVIMLVDLPEQEILVNLGVKMIVLKMKEKKVELVGVNKNKEDPIGMLELMITQANNHHQDLKEEDIEAVAEEIEVALVVVIEEISEAEEEETSEVEVKEEVISEAEEVIDQEPALNVMKKVILPEIVLMQMHKMIEVGLEETDHQINATIAKEKVTLLEIAQNLKNQEKDVNHVKITMVVITKEVTNVKEEMIIMMVVASNSMILNQLGKVPILAGVKMLELVIKTNGVQVETMITKKLVEPKVVGVQIPKIKMIRKKQMMVLVVEMRTPKSLVVVAAGEMKPKIIHKKMVVVGIEFNE